MTLAPEFALSVFGPPRFTERAGRSDREPTLTQRRLLERLALTPGEAVPLERLIDAVWDDDPPRHARAAVQNQISRIRAAWGDDVVLTASTGYTLGVTTDAQRLHELSARAEVLLEDGDARAAFDLAESLLPLWVGRPFTAIEHVEGVAAIRRGLSASCKGAENTRLAAGIALGRSAWAVAEGERLVAETPLDERRQAMLARALAIAGRRGDALAALAAARRLVRRELGIEPGPLLVDAEAEIRGGAPGRAADVSLPFTGRTQLVRTALKTLAAVGLARLTGEPGAGITRLLDELAARLTELGVRVVRADASDHVDSADGLLRDVREQLGAGDGPFGTALAEAARARPFTILVDDAHALGPAARAVLADASESPGVSAVLAGHGDDWADGDDAVIAVPPLGVADVAEILRRLGREHDGPSDAEGVHADCGGNPLVLAALLATEDRRGESLGDLARTLLVGLDRGERDLVEFAAVAGDDVAIEAGALPAMLTAAGDGRIAFRHRALRELVYRDLPPARREELHLQAAERAVAAGAPASVVARHRLAAGPLAAESPAVSARRA